MLFRRLVYKGWRWEHADVPDLLHSLKAAHLLRIQLSLPVLHLPVTAFLSTCCIRPPPHPHTEYLGPEVFQWLSPVWNIYTFIMKYLGDEIQAWTWDSFTFHMWTWQANIPRFLNFDWHNLNSQVWDFPHQCSVSYRLWSNLDFKFSD